MEGEVVGHERVHAIDGDELLGQRIGRRVMIGRRADDAAEQLFVVEEFEDVLQFSPPSPDQLTFIATCTTGCGTMAVVHSACGSSPSTPS